MKYEISARTLRHYNQMLREGTSFTMHLKSTEGDIEVLVDENGIAWKDGFPIGGAATVIERIVKGLPLDATSTPALVGAGVKSEPVPAVPTPSVPVVLTTAVRIKGICYGYNPSTKRYERVDG